MESTSLSDYDGYRNACKHAAEVDAAFATFKQNSEYRKTLEHVNREQGIMYATRIKGYNQLSDSDIQKAKENDEQGGPIQEQYDPPMGLISPSTIRYMSVLSELMAHFGDLTGYTIVEVGGGYGGQCKLTLDKFNIKEYHIYDLPEPLMLMQRYHKKYGYKNVVYHNALETIIAPETIDLFISNYAFSELRSPIQEVYLKDFISKAKHIHMVCNWVGGAFSRDELLAKLPNTKCEPEIPPWTETLYR